MILNANRANAQLPHRGWAFKLPLVLPVLLSLPVMLSSSQLHAEPISNLSSATLSAPVQDERYWLQRLLDPVNATYRGRAYHFFSDATLSDIRAVEVLYGQVSANEDDSGDAYIVEMIQPISGNIVADQPNSVVRVGEQLVFMSPNKEVAFYQNRLSHSDPKRSVSNRLFVTVEQIMKHYKLALSHEDTVAGIRAVKLAVTPRDQDRVHKAYWFEPNSGVVLKSTIRSGEGTLLESMEFLSIEIDVDHAHKELQQQLLSIYQKVSAGLVEEAVSPKSTKGVRASDERSQSSELSLEEQSILNPTWLPLGFRKISIDVSHQEAVKHEGGAQPHSGLASSFSDGVVNFTLFCDHVDSKRLLDRRELFSAPERVHQSGATLSLVRLIEPSDNQQEHQQVARVTLVGELPETTARKILQSINP